MQERSKPERILEAAQLVFARKGYYQAKMEEIADLAEVGKGTVYEYFTSKRELYKEMFKVLLNQYTEQVAVAKTADLPMQVRIKHMIQRHLQFMSDNSHNIPSNFGDVSGLDEEILSWMYDIRKESIERLISFFEEGMAKGELKDMDPELGANMLIGLLRGITVPLMMEGSYREPAEVAAELSDILFHGMAR